MIYSINFILYLSKPIRMCPGLKGRPKIFFTQACRGPFQSNSPVYTDGYSANQHDDSDTIEVLVLKNKNVEIY